jgi:hypothetical protein
VVTAIAGVLTMGGVLTFALFPFLLPILLLTGVFVAPLLLPLLLLPVLLAPVAAIVWASRRVRRRRQRPIRSMAHGRGEPAAARPRAQKHTIRHRHAA